MEITEIGTHLPSLAPFFNQSIDSLCIADYQGNFVQVNPAFQQLMGYTEEELYHAKIADFMYPEDREHTLAQRHKLKQGTPLINFENRYVTKSGTLVWLNWTSFSIPEKQLIYSIARNISPQKNIEQDRIKYIDRLSQTNDKLKQQNYSTSHDLRSPLNNLMSLVHLIDHDKIKDEETLEILDMIKQSAHGLKTTLDSYLDSFKATEPSLELDQVKFAPLLKKVKGSIGSLIKCTKTSFHVDFSALETVDYRSNYMESIFLNLITNSIKYARIGIPPEISITTHQDNGIKTLVYSDNGSGFDMDKVGHRIFKLNERFHNNKDSKGIGLYLVHQQITSLGGNIKVASQVNEGTTFTITFKS